MQSAGQCHTFVLQAKASDKEAKQIEKTVATTANRLGEPALTDYEKEVSLLPVRQTAGPSSQ